MRLVNISKVENAYLIKASVSYKFLGIEFMASDKFYKKKENENDWHEAKTGKKVPAKRKLKLNKWLKDHQKFIEKI